MALPRASPVGDGEVVDDGGHTTRGTQSVQARHEARRPAGATDGMSQTANPLTLMMLLLMMMMMMMMMMTSYAESTGHTEGASMDATSRRSKAVYRQGS
jgi:hypothetical protein